MLERSALPTGPWSTVLQPLTRANGLVRFDHDVEGFHSGFYRLRRTW
jgi:hypothetical protein